MRTIVQGELRDDLTGMCLELARQIRQSGGYPHNPVALKRQLQTLIDGNFYEWPQGIRAQNISAEYVAINLPAGEYTFFPGISAEGTVSHIWQKICKLGLKPADGDDMVTIINGKKGEPFFWESGCIGELLAITGWNNQTLASVATVKRGVKYVLKEVGPADWLKPHAPSGFRLIEDLIDSNNNPILWFFCKRPSVLG